MTKNVKITKTVKTGEELIRDIDLLLDYLNNASKIGILDIFSKDLLPTIVKRIKLNKAKDQFLTVNHKLEEFNKSVKDLGVIELEGISGTFIEETKKLDYLFGVIGHVHTQVKTKDARENLEKLRTSIIIIVENLNTISN